MSRSYFTKARIPVTFFPRKSGEVVLLAGKRVRRERFEEDTEDNDGSFRLVDESNDSWMGLYFKDDGYLSMFDFPYGFAWAGKATWMRHAILKEYKKRDKLPNPLDTIK